MAAIKSFTSLEQSKKLAEILPIESADMCYVSKDDRGIEFFEEPDVIDGTLEDVDIRCWSLAALFGVLPMITEGKDTANPFIAKTPDNEYYVVYATLTEDADSSAIFDNPVDACVDMIEKIHKLKML